MSVKKPSLLAKFFYYSAQQGWISLNQYSPFMRFAAVLHVFRLGLWKALPALTPHPLRALYALLFGKDRYLLRVSQSPLPVPLSISPMNFISLLHLVKLGHSPISADPNAGTLVMPMGKQTTLTLRSAKSGDLGILRELLADRDYGTDFQGYKIIDIGAYIGETALFFCDHGAQKVIAVEPAPDNYELAQKNIAQSPYADKITLLQVAVAASDGEMPFYLDEGNPQMHALFPTADNQAYFKAKRTLTVKVWSFERLMNYIGWEEVDLVKLDCEGAEFPILLDTDAGVLRRVKRWAIEYHASPEPLEKRLHELGYRIRRVKDLVMTGIIYAEVHK